MSLPGRTILPILLMVPVLAGGRFARAQELPSSPDAAPEAPTMQNAATVSPPLSASEGLTHAFWDRRNTLLFAGVGAFRVLDYTSTRNMRDRGRQEILLSNWVVDNRPLFVSIEAAAAGVSIGVSYVMHRTGHHKLERLVSIGHISGAAFGDARNYALKSGHHYPGVQ